VGDVVRHMAAVGDVRGGGVAAIPDDNRPVAALGLVRIGGNERGGGD
jgi:hypothetical protein